MSLPKCSRPERDDYSGGQRSVRHNHQFHCVRREGVYSSHMRKQIRRQSILKKWAMDGMTGSLGGEEFELFKYNTVS
jgi:hypothetical protein